MNLVVGALEAPFFMSDTPCDSAQLQLLERGFGDGSPMAIPATGRMADRTD